MVGIVTEVTDRGTRSAYGENDFHFLSSSQRVPNDNRSEFLVPSFPFICDAYIDRNWA